MFGVFEITPIALIIAAVGGLYLFLIGGRLLSGQAGADADVHGPHEQTGDGNMGDIDLFAVDRPFDVRRASI